MLLAWAFGAKLADESHRARLRVEVGRLRTMLQTLAGIGATKRGFVRFPRAKERTKESKRRPMYWRLVLGDLRPPKPKRLLYRSTGNEAFGHSPIEFRLISLNYSLEIDCPNDALSQVREGIRPISCRRG
jgi:hypothetical protein